MIGMAEYIWIDGATPTQTVRSKARTVLINDIDQVSLSDFDVWSFDGSSTNQSEGGNSDLFLQPVYFCPDPIRGAGSFLVMCEVNNPDGTPHKTNTRATLRSALTSGGDKAQAWIGFEQEYTLFKSNRPLGFPKNGFPAPQGPFYCGIGADRAFGRDIVEEHLLACHEAGLLLFGINAEVMPGQWEFQMGYRGFPNETADILLISDQMWIARWLLLRICEDYEVTVSWDNKPVKGDWNGAGCHTNFSTVDMRDPQKGISAIELAIERLSTKHDVHIKEYGHALGDRLTGLHETCAINEFRSGVADRGCSIRIPQLVKQRGFGYFEDRRPGANMDPYRVSARLLVTVCELAESVLTDRPEAAMVKETVTA